MRLPKHSIWLSALVVATGTANAADWSAETSLSESLSIDDNPDLSVDSPGFVFGSLSTLDLAVSAKTHRSKFDFLGSIGYQAYTGPGNDVVENGITPNAKIDYERNSKRLRLQAGAYYNLVRNGSSEDSTGSTFGGGYRSTAGANVSLTRLLDTQNELTAAVRGYSIDFQNPTPSDTPSVSLGTSLSWLHRATKRIDLNTSAGVDWYRDDDAINSRNTVYYLREDVTTRVNRRLKVNAGAGVTLLNRHKDDFALPGTPRRSSMELGGLANLGFSYALRTTTLGGFVSYGLSPDDDGELQNNITVGLNGQHKINDVSDLTVNAQVRFAETSGTSGFNETTFSIGPVYTREITPYWHFSLGYNFNLRENDEGTAIENSAFMRLKRDFVIVP